MNAPLNPRGRTRDRFEVQVVEALVTLSDLALEPGRPNEETVIAARGRAMALVDAWAHYLARIILSDYVIAPLSRKLRELDSIAAVALAGEGDGWRPFALPNEPGVARYVWRCVKCGDEIAVEVHARAEPSASVVAGAEALARIAGWDIREAGLRWNRVRAIHCPRCAALPSRV